MLYFSVRCMTSTVNFRYIYITSPKPSRWRVLMICLRRRVAIIIDSWSRTIPPTTHTRTKRSCSLNKTSHLQMRFIKHVHVVYLHLYTDTYNRQLSLCLCTSSLPSSSISPSHLSSSSLPSLSHQPKPLTSLHAHAHAYIHITHIYI